MRNRSHFAGVVLALLIAACGGSDGAEPSDRSTPVVAESSVDAGVAATEGASPQAPPRVGLQQPQDGGSAPAASDPASPASPTRNEVAATPTDPTAEGILSRAEEAYDAVRSMEADFVQNLTVALLGSSERSRGKIFHRRPDRFRMQFSQPAGDIVLADGEYLWMYYPSTDAKQVIRTALTDGTVQQVDFQQQFLSNAVDRFDARLVGEEPVNGRPAHVLVLIPTGSSEFQRVKLWVDKGDALVRRFEITEANGTVRELTLSNIRTNVTLSNDLFEFTPPPGTQVFTQ